MAERIESDELLRQEFHDRLVSGVRAWDLCIDLWTLECILFSECPTHEYYSLTNESLEWTSVCDVLVFIRCSVRWFNSLLNRFSVTGFLICRLVSSQIYGPNYCLLSRLDVVPCPTRSPETTPDPGVKYVVHITHKIIVLISPFALWRGHTASSQSIGLLLLEVLLDCQSAIQ